MVKVVQLYGGCRRPPYLDTRLEGLALPFEGYLLFNALHSITRLVYSITTALLTIRYRHSLLGRAVSTAIPSDSCEKEARSFTQLNLSTNPQ